MFRKLLVILLLFVPFIIYGQVNNTDKGAAIIYTKGAPTGAVRIKYDSEWAIDVNTSKVYRYDRTNSTWILAGSNIGYLNSTNAPTGAPKYGGPEFIINNDKELYWYYAGSWQCLNCGIIPYVGGTGINITGNTITNTLPDQTVVLSNGTGISVTGTYPNFTITNTAPDQTVTITGAGINSVTGTYPNFTITGTEVDGSITNEIQTIDSLILSGDTLIVSLSSDGVPASRLVLSGLTASSGGGIYGPSDTVTYQHLAVIDSGLTFSTTEDTGYLNIITAPGVYGSTAYYHPDSIRLRHYDIGGSNELILNDDGVLIKTTSPDRLVVQGNDARYFADYRATYSARSFIDKQYGDDFYLQEVDTFRVSNDTLYISLARDSVPESFVVLPTGSGLDTSGYNLDFRISNDTIYIRDGDGELFVKLPSEVVDTDDQTLSLSNDTLYISEGNNVYLGQYIDNTDSQELSIDSVIVGNLERFSISIDSGNTVRFDVPQPIDTSGYNLEFVRSNDTLYLTDGSGQLFVTLPPDQIGLDTSGYNLDLIITNDTLYITDGDGTLGVNLDPYLDNTDNQTLTVDSTDIGGTVERFGITISNGNTIYLDIPQVSGSGAGQNNVGANVGSGTGIYAGKVDTILQFKSLVEGYGVDLSSTATEVTIRVDTAEIATLNDVAVVQSDIDAHELADGDLSATNEIQQIDTFEINANILRLSLSNDNVPFKTVNLSPYLDNTDTSGYNTALVLSNDTLSITDGDGVLSVKLVGLNDGNGIYSDTGSVAPINDFLVRTRGDSTFAIGATNKSGFDAYWNEFDPGDYFSGVYVAPSYMGGVGLMVATVDSSLYNTLDIAEGRVTLSAEYGTGGNRNNAAIHLYNSVSGATYRGYAALQGFRNNVAYSYFLPASNPSPTLGDTSIAVWIGDGSGFAAPKFIPYEAPLAQTLSLDSAIVGSVERFAVSISGGNTIYFDVDAADSDAQTLSWNGTTEELTISNGNTVDLGLDAKYLPTTADNITANQIAFGTGTGITSSYKARLYPDGGPYDDEILYISAGNVSGMIGIVLDSIPANDAAVYALNVSSATSTWTAFKAESFGGDVTDVIIQSLSSNANASSDAVFLMTANSSGGDPHLRFSTGGANRWAVGVDNSDSDKFKFTYGSAANPGSTTTGLEINVSGNVGIGGAAVTAKALTVTGVQRLTSGTGTPTFILGRDASGDINNISIGTGLSFSSGTLSTSITQYTDEEAQDAVGTILVDGTTIDFTYNDGVPSITAEVIDGSITNSKLDDGVGGIYKGSGTIAASVVATMQAADQFIIDWSGGINALDFDDNSGRIRLLDGIGDAQVYVGGEVGLSSSVQVRSISQSKSFEVNPTNYVFNPDTGIVRIIMQEPSGSGANYTGFQVNALPQNLLYIMPVDVPSNGQVMTWNTGGQLSWEDAGNDINIYEDDGLLKNGGTEVGLDSGSLKLIMATTGSTKYGLEIIADNATTVNRFVSMRTQADSMRFQEFNSQYYMTVTTSYEQSIADQFRTAADSVQWIEGTVQSANTMPYILGMTSSNWMKRIEGTADGQVLVWDETNGYWEIGTASSSSYNFRKGLDETNGWVALGDSITSDVYNYIQHPIETAGRMVVGTTPLEAVGLGIGDWNEMGHAMYIVASEDTAGIIRHTGNGSNDPSAAWAKSIFGVYQTSFQLKSSGGSITSGLSTDFDLDAGLITSTVRNGSGTANTTEFKQEDFSIAMQSNGWNTSAGIVKSLDDQIYYTGGLEGYKIGTTFGYYSGIGRARSTAPGVTLIGRGNGQDTTVNFNVQTVFPTRVYNWIGIDMETDTTSDRVRLYNNKYGLANATPSQVAGDTSVMVWVGSDAFFMDKSDFGGTGSSYTFDNGLRDESGTVSLGVPIVTTGANAGAADGWSNTVLSERAITAYSSNNDAVAVQFNAGSYDFSGGALELIAMKDTSKLNNYFDTGSSDTTFSLFGMSYNSLYSTTYNPDLADQVAYSTSLSGANPRMIITASNSGNSSTTTFTANNTTFTDIAEYTSDLSGSYTDRTHVDRGYVTGVFAGSTNITTLGTITTGSIPITRLTDGTMAAALTATLTGSSFFVIDYNGGADAFKIDDGGDITMNTKANSQIFLNYSGSTGVIVDDANSATTIFSEDGSQYVTVGNDETTMYLDASPSTDHTASGTKIGLVANENQEFGDVCYINADGEAQLGDADGIATAKIAVMCMGTVTTGNVGTYLLVGVARDDTWNWTVGGHIYLSTTGTTGNTLTQTAPSGTDDCVVIVGTATHADRMLFNPSPVIIELN